MVHFIMKQEQLGYYDALRFLAKKYGIEVEERELTPEERRTQNERESMFALNEWASNYFHDALLHTEEGKTIGLAYFRSRGFRDDIIEKFRLGFSPTASDTMSNEALQEGYKEEYLVKTGLSFKRDNGTLYDKYHGRVIFPWFSISGKIVGFGGRVLDARTKGVNQKYINSAESEIYHKAKELFGLFQAKKAISKEHNVFMVEGYTDVISMHQCGIENVVANSGTCEEPICSLHEACASRYFFCPITTTQILSHASTTLQSFVSMSIPIRSISSLSRPISCSTRHRAIPTRCPTSSVAS